MRSQLCATNASFDLHSRRRETSGLDIQLVMTDRTLFDGDNEPAHLTGYGPIPAALARKLIRGASPQTTAWIRRLSTDPDTDHTNNRPTDITDGQGLCENCNYTKSAPGWHSRVDPNGHTITTTTPTGHHHSSDPPRPPQSEPMAGEPRISRSFIEER
jgi:hypothetical protein